MSGYNGFSMSNNAVDAYESGEKPLSKWTKFEILHSIKEMISNGDIELKIEFELLNKIKVKQLKTFFLKKSSWHHTSSRYNKTDFYDLDTNYIENLTEDKVKSLIDIKEQKQTTDETKALCKYLVWGGTQRHPKATETEEKGIIKGNWFYSDSGVKKSINANGFMILKRF